MAATHLLGLPLKHKPKDINPQGADSGLDADKVDGFHASELGGGGPHASSHETGGADKVHFADLEHDEGDITLHDNLTATPHISQAEKDKIHERQHALDSSLDHSGAITDAQHGSRGSGLHVDSHARQHALDSALDHTGTIADAQHGSRGAGLHADSHGLDHRGRQLLQVGLDAEKLAAGQAGRIYYATDTGIFYYDNGTSWEEYLRAETVTRLAQLSEKSHASLTGVTADQHHARSHDHSLAADGSPIAVAGVPNLPASKITSERFSMARMPDGTLGYFLKAAGAGVDPAYAALAAADIASGRFGMTRMPDGASGYFLRAAGAGADPAYAALAAGDTQSGRFIMARMPDGSLNYVIKGQGPGTDPAYGQVSHGELTGVTANQHHARDHNLLSAQHLDTLTDTPVSGDIIIANLTPKWSRLPKSTDGKYLKLVSGLPAWADPPAAADHSLLSSIHPDTLPDTPAAGDIIIANSTPKWARLAKGADGQFLKLISGLPAWAGLPVPLIDNVNATTDLTAVTGAWTDLLTVTRTLTETRYVTINAGYTALCGSSAGSLQIQIVVDGSAVAASVRRQYSAKSVDLHINTFHVVELASGGHTIKVQYYAAVAATIKERMITVTWDV